MTMPDFHISPYPCTNLHRGRRTRSFSVTIIKNNVCDMTSCVMDKRLHPHALVHRAGGTWPVPSFKLASKYSSREFTGRLRQKWTRLGYGHLFQYHGWDVCWEGHGDGYSHRVGYSLPESTRWDLGRVCPALTDCINSVWEKTKH